MKFSSDRLRRSNYKINITINEARKNGEIISQAENQLIRTLFQITNREFNREDLDSIKYEIKSLKKLLPIFPLSRLYSAM